MSAHAATEHQTADGAFRVEYERPVARLKSRALWAILTALPLILWLPSSHSFAVSRVITGMCICGFFGWLFVGTTIWRVEATTSGISAWTVSGLRRWLSWDDVGEVRAETSRGYRRLVFWRRANPADPRQRRGVPVLLTSTVAHRFDTNLTAIAGHCHELGIRIDGPYADELAIPIAVDAAPERDLPADTPWSAGIPPTRLKPLLLYPALVSVLVWGSLIAVATPHMRVRYTVAAIATESLFIGLMWMGFRRHALDGTITQETITATLPLRAPVVLSWTDITHAHVSQSSVGLTSRGGQRLSIRTDAKPVRDLVLQQLALRGIPTGAGAGSRPS